MSPSEARLDSTRPAVRWRALANGRLGGFLASATAICGALLIVVAPLYAWLLVCCAMQREPLSQVAAPLWFLLAEALAAWALARGLRGRRALAQVGAAVAPALVAVVLLLMFSPVSNIASSAGASLYDAAYGTFFDVGLSPSSVGLLAVAVYVWWASASDGAQRPDDARARRRFFLSVGATLGAIAFVVAAPADVRDAVAGQLIPLLAALIFTGLLSLTLNMLTIERQTPNVDPIFLRSQWRQISWATLMGGAIVIGALAVTLVATPDLLSAIFVRSGLAALVNLLLALIRALLALLAIHTPSFQLAPDVTYGPRPPMGILKPKPAAPTLPPIMAFLLLVAGILAVPALVYVISRAKRLAARTPKASTYEEERESLGAQIRAWLHPRVRDAAELDTLGAVRALYRDLLRRAARSGLGRAPQQTPREYAALLSAAPPFSTHDTQYVEDLRQVSDAYAEARYAEREPPLDQLPSLRERARRLRDLLNLRARR